MGAGYRQHPTTAQYVFGQPLGPRHIGIAGVQDGFHQRVAPRHDVADHVKIGPKLALRGVEAFDQVDPERAQLIAHGGIDVGVAAGHPQAGLTCDGREPAHEGAADSKNVDMHRDASLPESLG